MRSWDPMRNFPELDGLSETAARQLVVQTQRHVSRQPAILAGLVVTVAVAALAAYNLLSGDGLVGSLLVGLVMGLAAAAYMVVVIKPRMQAAFREMGYPKR